MDTHFHKELLSHELIDEITPLIIKHNEEVDDKVQDVKWPQYIQMQEAGIYRFYTVRKDGELIGYCGFIIMPSHHHEGMMGVNDVIFLEAEHRKGSLGYNFLKYCIDEVVKLNVVSINLTTTLSPDLSPLFEKLGFTMIEKTHRRLYGL